MTRTAARNATSLVFAASVVAVATLGLFSHRGKRGRGPLPARLLPGFQSSAAASLRWHDERGSVLLRRSGSKFIVVEPPGHVIRDDAIRALLGAIETADVLRHAPPELAIREAREFEVQAGHHRWTFFVAPANDIYGNGLFVTDDARMLIEPYVLEALLVDIDTMYR